MPGDRRLELERESICQSFYVKFICIIIPVHGRALQTCKTGLDRTCNSIICIGNRKSLLNAKKILSILMSSVTFLCQAVKPSLKLQHVAQQGSEVQQGSGPRVQSSGSGVKEAQ